MAVLLVIVAAIAVISLVFTVKWFLRYLASRTVAGLMQVGERQLGRVVGVGEKHLDKALEAGGKEIAKGVAKVAEDMRKNDPKRIETEITRLAREKQGVVAVADVMASLELPQFKAQQALAGLVRNRVCKIETGPLGSRYIFEAFLKKVEQFRCPYCETTYPEAPETGICASCGGSIQKETVHSKPV